ncbi:TrbC family F-type conjugative pilus assembly protein [Thermodesulfobacteriota bacterium B35]
MLYLLRLILVVLCLCAPFTGEAGDLDTDVAAALARGRDAAGSIILPSEKTLAEGREAAEKAVSGYRSPEFRARIRKEQRRVCTASVQTGRESGRTALDRDERIYLFLSSSIPDETVHNYLVDIAGVNEPALVPVMRGLVGGFGGDMQESARYFARVLKKDPACEDDLEHQRHCERLKIRILFQPPLFEKYSISRVPAVIYDNGDQAFLVHGDAALDYLLERISQEAHDKGLEDLVARIRGRNNE